MGGKFASQQSFTFSKQQSKKWLINTERKASSFIKASRLEEKDDKIESERILLFERPAA